ncbi:MAG: biotin transporter BioY [Lachnospiraceae bacterium]
MSESKSKKMKTLDMVYCAMFAVVIAICSWISVQATVPFTLQTFGVFLAVGCLGGRRGTISVLIYLLLGAIGVPVFAGFSGGMGIILGTTGGYIIGFLFSALVMWAMEKLLGKKTWVLALSMVIGLLVCYIFGTAWFMVVYANNVEKIGLWTALGWCVFPFIIPDIIKIVLALGVCKSLAKVIRHYVEV